MKRKEPTTTDLLTDLLEDARVSDAGCQQSVDRGYPPTKAQLLAEWRRKLWKLQIIYLTKAGLFTAAELEMIKQIKALAAKWGVTL